MVVGGLGPGHEAVDERDGLGKTGEGELLPDLIAFERPALQRFQALFRIGQGELRHHLLRFSGPHLVEPQPCRFHGFEAGLLHFDRRRPLGRVREGAAGDRSMIVAFCLLQRGERVGVLALPLEPGGQPRRRFSFGGSGAFDAEARPVLAFGPRNPRRRQRR